MKSIKKLSIYGILISLIFFCLIIYLSPKPGEYGVVITDRNILKDVIDKAINDFVTRGVLC